MKTLALILAGGKGSRLGALTERRSKPAAPFAGIFRLIDIPLSNLVHSGLTDVWVVEQFRPHSLNEHLANGRTWDLDRNRGGLRVLPPYTGGNKDAFPHGNADAIYQHLDFIREFEAETILVLSSDHVYTLNFRRVLEAHREREADVTMVTTKVPREDASRFGVVETDGDRVTGFAYKPDEPKTGTVTTEIFAFGADVLLDTLGELASAKGEDEHLEDYGDELLPRLVDRGRAFAFALDGYWRDVGTVESYWEGHMDLLNPDVQTPFDQEAWPILTPSPHRLPARLHRTARVDNGLVSPGCDVRGEVVRSVLGPGVTIEEGATVRDAVLLGKAKVARGADVRHAILDEGVTVGADVRVGGSGDGGKRPEITVEVVWRDRGRRTSGRRQVRVGLDVRGWTRRQRPLRTRQTASGARTGFSEGLGSSGRTSGHCANVLACMPFPIRSRFPLPPHPACCTGPCCATKESAWPGGRRPPTAGSSSQQSAWPVATSPSSSSRSASSPTCSSGRCSPAPKRSRSSTPTS